MPVAGGNIALPAPEFDKFMRRGSNEDVSNEAALLERSVPPPRIEESKVEAFDAIGIIAPPNEPEGASGTSVSGDSNCCRYTSSVTYSDRSFLEEEWVQMSKGTEILAWPHWFDFAFSSLLQHETVKVLSPHRPRCYLALMLLFSSCLSKFVFELFFVKAAKLRAFEKRLVSFILPDATRMSLHVQGFTFFNIVPPKIGLSAPSDSSRHCKLFDLL
jgi:hypothetical protein